MTGTRGVNYSPAPSVEEYRELVALGEPLTADALDRLRSKVAKAAARPKRRRVLRCVGCRVVITGTEDYTPGCSACSERRKKRRQRGEEVDDNE